MISISEPFRTSLIKFFPVINTIPKPLFASGNAKCEPCRTFTFITKTPPVSYFLKKAASVGKGSTLPGRGATVGSVTAAQIREIAEQKMKDMNAFDVEAACRMIRGSAVSMGLEVVE